MSALPFHPLANLFPLLDGEEFDAFVADIKAHGLRQRIVLCNGAILEGRNRYRACIEADIEPRFEQFNGRDPLAYVVSLNLARRHLNESQRAMVHARIATLPKGSNQHTAIAAPTQERAAALLNISIDSGQRARKVLEQGIPELAGKIDRGDISVSAAAEVARLAESEQREIVARGEKEILAAAREIRAEHAEEKKAARTKREAALGAMQCALPSKKYGVIVGDPEVRFEPWSRETGMDRAADNHYPTSATEVIAARDVASIAADDCVLFLWATVPMLPDALHVMAAWGFEYKSHCVWAKDRIGTGYWFRNKHELLLIGTRGNIPAPAMGTQWPSLIEAPVGKHSAKPEKFLEMIEEYFPSLPKIELNRRGPARPGWDAWGDEASEAEAPAIREAAE